MTMYYVGQKIIVGYMSLKNTLFQKPTFEWVWRPTYFIFYRSRWWFQKPTFEWVWRLIDNAVDIGPDWFQKPTFEWVWRQRKPTEAAVAVQVSEAHI